MTTSQPTAPWHHPTPARFFAALLAVQVFLFLSERFDWVPFNEKKGRTVLIAVGVVGMAVLVMLVWGLVCLCLRRRFQFGVRSLLVFLVAVSVPLSWFAWEMQKARRQKDAVEAIAKAGGWVMYDYQFDGRGNWLDERDEAEPMTPARLRKLFGNDFFAKVVLVNCGSTGFDDNDAKHLRELTNLKVLDLSRTQITNKGLVHLETMTELEGLDLSGTQVTDHGFAYLKEMTKLDTLILEDTQISDQGLVHLKRMTRLDQLWLGGTQISDAGLRHLSGLGKLESLSLYRTQISDAGLDDLARLTNLHYLIIYQTKITKEGADKLKRALPNCEIHP
jgi:hypothetical protein